MEDPKCFILLSNKNKNVMQYATCSPEHFDELNSIKWHLNKQGYAKSSSLPDQRFALMHVYVMVKLEGHVIPDGCVIDHKPPNNRLDNRPHMLRISTFAQNAQNRTKSKHASSRFYGVFFIWDAKKYRTTVKINGVAHYVGQYDTEIEAARAYDTFILNRPDYDELRFNLNFPDEKNLLAALEPYKKKQKTTKFANVHESSHGFRAQLEVNHVRVLDVFRHTEKECAELVDDCVVKFGLNRPLTFPERYPLYVAPTVVKTQKEDVDESTVRVLLKSMPAYVILIDREDYERVMYGTLLKAKHGYIDFKINGKKYALHRFIVGETNSKILIDHIDNDPRNNRKNNLRRTTAKGNAQNKSRKNKTIGVRRTEDGIYSAKISDSSFKYFKTHKTEEHALRDRDLMIIKHLPNSLYPLHFQWTQSEIDYWYRILHNKN